MPKPPPDDRVEELLEEILATNQEILATLQASLNAHEHNRAVLLCIKQIALVTAGGKWPWSGDIEEYTEIRLCGHNAQPPE